MNMKYKIVRVMYWLALGWGLLFAIHDIDWKQPGNSVNYIHYFLMLLILLAGSFTLFSRKPLELNSSRLRSLALALACLIVWAAYLHWSGKRHLASMYRQEMMSTQQKHGGG